MVEIDLKRFVKILYERKEICLLIFLTCIFVGVIYSFFLLQPEYSSFAKVSIKSDDISIIDFVKNDMIMEECMNRIQNNEIDLLFLKQHTKISFQISSNTLDIIVSTKEPQLSRLIIEEYLEVLKIKLEEVYDIKNYVVVEEPKEDMEPNNIHHIEDMIKFSVMGGIIVLLYGLAKYMKMDTVVRFK